MIQKNITPLLEKGESTLIQIDKHPMTYIVTILLSILFILSGLMIVIYRSGIESILGNGLFWGGFSIYVIVFISFLLISFFSDFLDTLIITENRVISLEKTLPFGRETRIINIKDITEIHGESKGILQTIFGYGTITIGYMGGTQRLHFYFSPKPSDIIQQIHQIKENHTKNTNTVA